MKYILSLILLSHVNVGEGVEGMEATKTKDRLGLLELVLTPRKSVKRTLRMSHSQHQQPDLEKFCIDVRSCLFEIYPHLLIFPPPSRKVKSR